LRFIFQVHIQIFSSCFLLFLFCFVFVLFAIHFVVGLIDDTFHTKSSNVVMCAVNSGLHFLSCTVYIGNAMMWVVRACACVCVRVRAKGREEVSPVVSNSVSR